MKNWTVFTAPDRQPVLVAEGFSVGAFLFGPLWLAADGYWTMALATLVVEVAVIMEAPPWGLWLYAVLFCVLGRDIKRLWLARRGYELTDVVLAGNEDDALARLLDHRPNLLADAMT